MANNQLKNRLKEIFTQWGFSRVVPSKRLLADLGMTSKRFFQLVDNRGAIEMTVSEQRALESWLKRIENTDLSLFRESNHKEEQA
jgi:hypothetical protein